MTNIIPATTKIPRENTLLHYANNANLTSVLKHNMASIQGMVVADTLWECLEKNGTLKVSDLYKIIIIHDNGRYHGGNTYDRFCWIRATVREKWATVVKVNMKDCKDNDNTMLVFELNSTLPHTPSLRPIVDICSSKQNKEYFGETDEVLVLVTKRTASRNKFLIHVYGRSPDQLKVHYITQHQGK